ncbi:MAG: helix-hairpin-helix domain-containing protein [candidate division WOR-3 bacterium]
MTLIYLFFLTLNQDFWENAQEKDLETILWELEELKDNPLDLNTAGLEELSKIPFLKPTDCLKIIGYRERYGEFESVDDLLKIKGFEKGLLELVRPYLTVNTRKIKWRGLHNSIRFQKELNSSEKFYTRTILNLNDYQIFLVTEKDPGESSFFDYYSTGVVVEEKQRKFALGNYNLDYGAGVMLSTLGSFFSGSDFRFLIRERGITPYTSTMENGGFFGAALSDTLLLNYCIFYSNQKLDGKVDTSGHAWSFDPSGIHADSAGLARKDRIREEIIGYYLNYKTKTFQLYQSTYWSAYEPTFVCRDSNNEFYGKDYTLTGIGGRYGGERFIVFGEFARSFASRLGCIFGWTGLLPYNFEFSLAGSVFNPGFYAPKGIEAKDDYLGLCIDFVQHSRIFNSGTTVNIYTNSLNDTTHYDLRLNFGRTIGFTETKLTFNWRYRQSYKISSGSKVSLRLQPRKPIYLDLRLQDKYLYGDSIKKGLFGGIEFGWSGALIGSKIGFGIYDTESYLTRIYVYEPDLPGVLNNRVAYGKGRYGFGYLMVKPLPKIVLHCKYAINEKDSLIHTLGFQAEIKI